MPTTTDVLHRHLQSFDEKDLDGCQAWRIVFDAPASRRR